MFILNIMFPIKCFLLKCVLLPEISTLAFTLLSISWFYPFVGYWYSILECNLLRAVHSVHLGKKTPWITENVCLFFVCFLQLGLDMVSKKLHSHLKFSFASLEYICTKPSWKMLRSIYWPVSSLCSFMSQYKEWNCDNIVKLCITLDNANNLSTISQKLYRTAFLLATSPIHNRCLCLMSANIGEGMCCNLCLKDTFVWCPVLVTVTIPHRQHIHLWHNPAPKIQCVKTHWLWTISQQLGCLLHDYLKVWKGTRKVPVLLQLWGLLVFISYCISWYDYTTHVKSFSVWKYM